MSEAFQLDKEKATRAYVMINCENDCESRVFYELKTIPQIKKAETTIGRHDILALIHADSPEELGDIIAMKIRRISEVRSTTTLVCTEPRE
jgi:DNA-binding Lrp family transcriptional regulator